MTNNQPLLPGKMNLTIDQLTPVACQNCQGEVFNEGFFLRELSPLITGERETKLAPIPVFVCIHCKEILQKYLPDGLKKKKIVI